MIHYLNTHPARSATIISLAILAATMFALSSACKAERQAHAAQGGSLDNYQCDKP